jgi:hypothetical protein
MGTSSKVELNLSGNGIVTTDALLGQLKAETFDASNTVTLKVTDADLVSAIKLAKTLAEGGIDQLKAVSGTLKLSIADATTLINEGITFSGGGFQITANLDGGMSLESARTLVIKGGLKLPLQADGKPAAINTEGQAITATEALKLINAGGSFPAINGLKPPPVLVEAADLFGNADTVSAKLMSLSNYNLQYVFAADGQAASSGVQFASGQLTLSGLNFSLEKINTLVEPCYCYIPRTTSIIILPCCQH